MISVRYLLLVGYLTQNARSVEMRKKSKKHFANLCDIGRQFDLWSAWNSELPRVSVDGPSSPTRRWRFWEWAKSSTESFKDSWAFLKHQAIHARPPWPQQPSNTLEHIATFLEHIIEHKINEHNIKKISPKNKPCTGNSWSQRQRQGHIPVIRNHMNHGVGDRT